MTRACRCILTRLFAVTVLTLTVGAATQSLAQNPVDPLQSSVESHCDFVILTAPGGTDSDFGDAGIVITCLNATGVPVEGIPGAAFTLVDLDDVGEWPVSAVATSADGRTLLTGDPGPPYTMVHGRVGVSVDYGGGPSVLVDNGGAGFLLEMRSPDLNGDYAVNLSDVVMFAAAFGCCEDTDACQRCDFTGDGCVDLADLVILERYLGSSEQPAAAGKRTVDRPVENLFLGCIQWDFGADSDPETIEQQVAAIPGQPFYLRFVARDFSGLTGADFEFTVPPTVIVANGSTVSEFPTELPAPAAPGNERVVVSGDCATTGPLFIYEFMLISTTMQTYTIADFPFAHARFSDCSYNPQVRDACIGSPTPCQMSYVQPGLGMFLTCPGGDLDTVDVVTVVMNDQDGLGIPGIPADDFRVLLEDERGSGRGDMLRFTPLAAATDANGSLPFEMELREDCRWDVCLDLYITVRYLACDLHARKKIRTINVVPAISQGQQADGEINAADLAYWAAAVYTYDECLALTGNYLCPVVTPADANIAIAHLGCSCSVVASPLPARAGAVAMHQNQPNPFNPRTEIRVDLSRPAASAQLEVYDLRGRLVASIHDGSMPAGRSVYVWDGRDAEGQAVSSGNYIACLRALEDVAAVRMLLLR